MITTSSVQRILSLLPDPSRVCDTTCYGPIRYTAAGGVQVLMTQGGVIFPFNMQDYSTRHADQLYRSTRAGGVWSMPLETVTRKNGGPWMSDQDYMNAHPEDFISAWTVGNVVKIGSEYVGIFCGCCADPNCGTEWGPVPTVYGSRLSPFPYFNAFLFRSPNGIDQWQMVTNPYGLNTGDKLLDARFMGLTPMPSDYNLPPAGPTGFKGLDKCSIGVLHDDGHWCGTADFWSSFGPKTLVWRIDQSAFTAVLAGDSIGSGALPEIWNGSQWSSRTMASRPSSTHPISLRLRLRHPRHAGARSTGSPALHDRALSCRRRHRRSSAWLGSRSRTTSFNGHEGSHHRSDAL